MRPPIVNWGSSLRYGLPRGLAGVACLLLASGMPSANDRVLLAQAAGKSRPGDVVIINDPNKTNDPNKSAKAARVATDKTPDLYGATTAKTTTKKAADKKLIPPAPVAAVPRIVPSQQATERVSNPIPPARRITELPPLPVASPPVPPSWLRRQRAEAAAARARRESARYTSGYGGNPFADGYGRIRSGDRRWEGRRWRDGRPWALCRRLARRCNRGVRSACRQWRRSC